MLITNITVDLECKIEKGLIVDSKDWRRRKFKDKDDQK